MKIESGEIKSIDRVEAARYLGYVRGAERDEALFDECEELLLPLLRPRAVYEIYSLSAEGDKLDLGFTSTVSKNLAKNLSGCNKIALFAATIGDGADRLILKYGKLSPARAAVIGAMGSAAAEQWCDELERRIKSNFSGGAPRFSCGYGDLPLGLQREIFAALNVAKNIGVTLTESLMMSPSKSVTAIVGLK